MKDRLQVIENGLRQLKLGGILYTTHNSAVFSAFILGYDINKSTYDNLDTFLSNHIIDINNLIVFKNNIYLFLNENKNYVKNDNKVIEDALKCISDELKTDKTIEVLLDKLTINNEKDISFNLIIEMYTGFNPLITEEQLMPKTTIFNYSVFEGFGYYGNTIDYYSIKSNSIYLNNVVRNIDNIPESILFKLVRNLRDKKAFDMYTKNNEIKLLSLENRNVLLANILDNTVRPKFISNIVAKGCKEILNIDILNKTNLNKIEFENKKISIFNDIVFVYGINILTESIDESTINIMRLTLDKLNSYKSIKSYLSSPANNKQRIMSDYIIYLYDLYLLNTNNTSEFEKIESYIMEKELLKK